MNMFEVLQKVLLFILIQLMHRSILQIALLPGGQPAETAGSPEKKAQLVFLKQKIIIWIS